MMTVLMTVFKVIIIPIIVCAPVIFAYDDCDAFYTNNENGKNPGKCVPFQECPYLFDMIKSRTKSAAEIRLLQQLTCRRDLENPYICCSVDDIPKAVDNNPLSVYTVDKHKNSNLVDPSDTIVFGTPPKTADRMSNDHPKFKLLPSLRECSANILGMRILGGNETTITEYPWMARIGYYSLEEDTIKYLCAGTIISKRYILTAAHCTEEVNPEEFELSHIRISEKDRECDETYGCHTPKDIKIERVIPHPKYSKRDKSNDIGLIRLAEDIEFKGNVFAQPICLPFVEEYGLKREDVDPTLSRHLDSGNYSAWVAGWGKTRWNNVDGSEYLQHVALPILSISQCRKSYENHRRVIITDLQICAGGVRGKDSCGGDSGGGLFVYEKVPIIGKIKATKMFQYGVVSFGPTHCGVGGLPGVYSNTYKYKNWILDQLEA